MKEAQYICYSPFPRIREIINSETNFKIFYDNQSYDLMVCFSEWN